jgi:hypothetical protein
MAIDVPASIVTIPAAVSGEELSVSARLVAVSVALPAVAVSCRRGDDEVAARGAGEVRAGGRGGCG